MTDSGEVGDAGRPFELKLQLAWPNNLGAQAQPVNQVVFTWDQNYHDMLYMYLGHVAQPLWLTDDVARQRAAEVGNTLAVEPKGVFVMGRARAEELWEALGKHLGKSPNA